MANPYFQFKQFTVWHDKCAMKVGTDGVLLGAWTSVENTRSILDVGCGTGLISLMLAQRCQAIIDALDIDPAACMQARENADRSPFGQRLQVIHRPFADCVTEFAGIRQYDCIVSNPPYFINSLKCPDKQRNQARHTDTLSLDELISGSKQLLSPGGRLCLILPFDPYCRTGKGQSPSHIGTAFRISSADYRYQTAKPVIPFADPDSG